MKHREKNYIAPLQNDRLTAGVLYMVVSDFTVPELEHLRTQCNFVGNEIEVFELRSKGIPLERIAEELNMSYEGIKKVSIKVNKKIKKVL